jgi:hypothetical protein
LATRSKNLLNQPFFWIGLEFLEILLFAMTVTLVSDEIRFEIRGKTITVENTLVADGCQGQRALLNRSAIL